MKKLKELKNKYKNEDIYVLGSGASLGFVNPEFFNNKIVICVNYTINNIENSENKYLIAKELSTNMQNIAKNKNIPVVVCKYHSGCVGATLNTSLFPESTYVFDIIPSPEYASLDPELDSYLYVSASTITSGIHLAAFMGARNIILVGHDCGAVDNKIHVKGYDKSTAVTMEQTYHLWMMGTNVEYTTILLKEELKKKYGTNIYSLNPFTSMALDGHSYFPFGNMAEQPEFINRKKKIKGVFQKVRNNVMTREDAKQLSARLRANSSFNFHPNL